MFFRAGTIRLYSKIAAPSRALLFVPSSKTGTGSLSWKQMSTARTLLQQQQQQQVVSHNRCCYNRSGSSVIRNGRYFSNESSSSSSSSQQKKTSSSSKSGGEEEMTSEMVLTPGQKVAAGSRLTIFAGIAVVVVTCAYYIGKELIPTKMSPNSIFDKATQIVRDSTDVQRRFGTPLKVYGRDHGGHREGRRNFVEHTQYTCPEDGSDRVRVRFNVEGPHGNAFVFAEVSSSMSSGEFVYVLVQDKRNGRVMTVVDNRSALMAKKMAGANAEGQAVLANLLGGGKN